MTNSQLIEAIRRLLSGAELSGREASEIVALVVQNTRKPRVERFTVPFRIERIEHKKEEKG